MKKLLPLLLILLFFFTSNNFSQQITNFQLEVYPGLTQLNLASLAASKNLKGVQRVFRIRMEPENVLVRMTGSIHWTAPGGERKRLANFTTEPFMSFSFSNDETSKLERIETTGSESFNDDVLEDLIKKGGGRLTGVIEIELDLIDINNPNNILPTQRETLSFLNPVQTLTIRSPFPGSSEDVGSAILEWDKVAGAVAYVVRANVRKDDDQSYEEALSSGNPIIDDKRLSETRTRVNMREILDREWLMGQEIVVQVSAVIEGAGGNQDLKSDIVNFFINDPTKVTQRQITDPEELLNEIFMGNIKLSDLKRVTVDGKRIPNAQILALINFLKANPDLIVNKQFRRK